MRKKILLTSLALTLALALLIAPGAIGAKRPLPPQPKHPIVADVYATPAALRDFGGAAGVRALAAVEFRGQVNTALIGSGLYPDQGFRVEIAFHSGVVTDDLQSACDASTIWGRFFSDKKVAEIRRKTKRAMQVLIFSCPEVHHTIGWAMAATQPGDFKNPAIGYLILMAGGLGAPDNAVGPHEAGHAIGAAMHQDCLTAEAIAPNGGRKPSPYGNSCGFVMAPMDGATVDCDVMAIHCNHGLFYSHPGKDEYGRDTGDEHHDVADSIKANWDAFVALGAVPWKPR